MNKTVSVVLAGGGTAGHIEPAMAVADALTALDPDVRITALGTERGLETRLVPERGYDLELITPVPLPRKPSGDLVRLPMRVRRAVRQTRAVLDSVDADVIIGFGGYVALPAYLAARGGLGRRRQIEGVLGAVGVQHRDTGSGEVRGRGCDGAVDRLGALGATEHQQHPCVLGEPEVGPRLAPQRRPVQ